MSEFADKLDSDANIFYKKMEELKENNAPAEEIVKLTSDYLDDFCDFTGLIPKDKKDNHKLNQ